VWSAGVAASLLTVWSNALNPRSRERGGRTTIQRGGDRCKLSKIPNCTVCPSDSRFHSITKDLRRFREMPSFALSRRQHGFESRWGYKIKRPLTRPDTAPSQPVRPWLHRQGRARDAETPACAAFGRAPDHPTLLAQTWLECRRSGAVARLDLAWDRRAFAPCNYMPKGYPTCRRPPSTFDPP
jgi:hypothetical protein